MAASGSNRVAFNNFLFLSALLLAGGTTSYNNKMRILKRIRTISPRLTSFLVANVLVLPLSQDFPAQVFKLRIATKPGLHLFHPIIATKPSFQRSATKTVLRLITHQECVHFVIMLILLALPSYTNVSLFNDMF